MLQIERTEFTAINVLEKEMRRIRNVFSVYAAIGLLVLGLGATADAQQRNERQVRDIVRSLNSRLDDFRYSLDDRFRSSSVSRQDADNLRRSVANLQDKISAFDENMNQRRENRDDVQEIVTAANDVEAFLRIGSRPDRTMQSDWTGVRNLIDRLATNYGVTPDWTGRVSNYPGIRDNNGGGNYPSQSTRNYPPSTSTSALSNGLTGTYKLDAGRTENIDDLLTGKSVSAEQRDELESKLEAPEELALDVSGSRVTLASSKTQPVTFVADGSTRSETIAGRNMQLRASFRGQDLVVSTSGGESDFTITFSPADNGRSMKVTRRVTTEYLNESVIADSYYTKTESVAGLGIDRNATASADDGTFSSNDPNDRAGANSNSYPTINQGRTGDFVVPNGTTLVAELDNEVNTSVSQNNDRFKMIVQSPNEFRGAVIEGHLSGVGRSGLVSGRSNVTFNFDRITLRNGQSYDFAGNIQSIRDQNGKDVKIDNEGTAKGQSQTKETAKRGGLGAGLGAIIGAIAGGGTGAAVGAIIGGGVGAGSVVVQGRDDLRLLKGSTVTIQSSSPIRRDQPVSEN
jgi:hypothetical protein